MRGLFSAVAVVLVTCGITSNGRRTGTRPQACDDMVEGLLPSMSLNTGMWFIVSSGALKS